MAADLGKYRSTTKAASPTPAQRRGSGKHAFARSRGLESLRARSSPEHVLSYYANAGTDAACPIMGFGVGSWLRRWQGGEKC